MPTPDLDCRLPMRVAFSEIGGGPEPLSGCSELGGVRVLLLRRGLPVAWTTLTPAGGEVSEASLENGLVRSAEAPARALDELLGRGALAAQAPLPPISVIVCTRDRADSLRRCLASLGRLDYPRFEVIVVDNASRTDATYEAAREAGARCVLEKRPGLDWARNRGLAEARHTLVAYTDDDVEVEPGWLRGVARAFAVPDVVGMTGLIAPAALETEAELLFELVYGGMGKGPAARRFDPMRMSADAIIAAHHCGAGANMAFRREPLRELGGFDTALDVGTPSHGGGDLDIFHRTLARGGVLAYEPSAIVRHHHRRELEALRRQHRDNGRGFGAYLITVFVRGAVSRRVTLAHTLRWLRWLVGRGLRRLRRREQLPGSLLLGELVGALQAPWAYWRSRRSDRALRAREGGAERAAR